MNYLAHIFLSGDDPEIRLGNFIGDAVKGRTFPGYPRKMAEGILLHRAIDDYTDRHPSVREATGSLKPHFGRYSGVLLDIYFDYLLASRFDRFSAVSLDRFARRFYFSMIRRRRCLPPRIRSFMWHFIGTNRLCKYATTDGIRDSLDIMVKYRGLGIYPDQAVEYLSEHKKIPKEVFDPFFDELREFCGEFIRTRAK